MISFKLSDQFLRTIKVSKGFNELSDSVKLLSLSKGNDNELNLTKSETKEAYDTYLEGIHLWNEIKSNYNEWSDLLKLADSNTIIKEDTFNEDMGKINIKIQNFEAVITEDIIPDYMAYGTKDSPLTPEVLETTIQFFLGYDYYRQLACLMTYQNPPITPDQLNEISIEQLTKLFEHLFMMNPDKLDLFFDPIYPKYADAISALLLTQKFIPKKFNQIVVKLMLNSEGNYSQISSAIKEYYLRSNLESRKNTDNILRRNEQFIKFFDLSAADNKYLKNDDSS